MPGYHANETLTRERIDYCELCGRLDHHLRAGLCARCARQTHTESTADDALGAEADVSAAMRVLRGAA